MLYCRWPQTPRLTRSLARATGPARTDARWRACWRASSASVRLGPRASRTSTLAVSQLVACVRMCHATPGLLHAFFTPGLLPISVCSQWARDNCCQFLRFVANTAYVLLCQRRTQAGNCTRGRTAPCVRAGYGPRSSCRSWCASGPCERWAVSSVCRPARCSNCSRSRRCSRRPWRAPPAVIVHFGGGLWIARAPERGCPCGGLLEVVQCRPRVDTTSWRRRSSAHA